MCGIGEEDFERGEVVVHVDGGFIKIGGNQEDFFVVVFGEGDDVCMDSIQMFGR